MMNEKNVFRERANRIKEVVYLKREYEKVFHMFREFIEGDWKNIEVELIRGILPRRFLLTCRNAYSYDSRFTVASFFVIDEHTLEATLVYGNSDSDEIASLKNEDALVDYLSAVSESESFHDVLKMTNDFPALAVYQGLLRAGNTASSSSSNIHFQVNADVLREQLKSTTAVKFQIEKPTNFNPDISVYTYEISGATNQCFVKENADDSTKLDILTFSGFSSTAISDLRKG